MSAFTGLKHTNHSRKGNGSPRTVTPDAQEEPPAAPAPPPVDRTAPILSLSR